MLLWTGQAVLLGAELEQFGAVAPQVQGLPRCIQSPTPVLFYLLWHSIKIKPIVRPPPQPLLERGVAKELLDLVKLPSMSGTHARALFDGGFTSCGLKSPCVFAQFLMA